MGANNPGQNREQQTRVPVDELLAPLALTTSLQVWLFPQQSCFTSSSVGFGTPSRGCSSLSLPIYANVFSGGKVLIRFSNTNSTPRLPGPNSSERREMILTAVFVLVFLIGLVAQSNIGMVTGDIPDAMVCQDGTVDLLGLCDGGQGGVADACDSSCVMENSTPGDRIFEAYLSEDILMFMCCHPSYRSGGTYLGLGTFSLHRGQEDTIVAHR